MTLETARGKRAITGWGQHFSYALPDVPLPEWFMNADAGQLASDKLPPGTPMPNNGADVLSNSPGFSLEIPDCRTVRRDHT